MIVRKILRVSPIVAGLVLAALPALVGCEEYVKPPIQARQDPYSRDQIHLASDSLRAKTAVEAPQLTRDDGGLLHVTLPIRAATDQQLYIDYRVTFFDKDGKIINQTGWFTKTLAPNVPDQVTVNSTSAMAADFQMDLRWAK